jgi:mono/diheme cytochrome c family protein
VVFLSHSTALSGALVSPLNPRAIMVGSLTVVAFNRGVQQAELASLDRQSGEINLYLVSFQQACNAAPSGCTHGDLFTPRVESDWTQVSIHEAEDLKNTPSDCRECHQRNVDKPPLLMRELDGPWTHFFAAQEGDAIYPAPAAGFRDIPEPDGADLLGDYLSAKGDESYAGVPTAVLRNTIGFTLENFVTIPQPLVFDGSEIMNERWPWTEADGYAKTPVRSPMWDAAFDAFKRGDQLALPFYAPRVADPDKQAKLTDAYRRYSSGELDADALPDLADIFPDDAQTRAEIGLQSTPDATPAEALVQACGTCHSDVLDQTVSRARFNIAVSRLGRPELDEAIARLKLPRGAAGSMPPPGRRQLDPAAIAPLIAFLKASQHPDRDDAFLEHAAEVGMAAARQN